MSAAVARNVQALGTTAVVDRALFEELELDGEAAEGGDPGRNQGLGVFPARGHGPTRPPSATNRTAVRERAARELPHSRVARQLARMPPRRIGNRSNQSTPQYGCRG